MKKNLDSLIEQVLENIKNDRDETEYLLGQLKEYMLLSPERYSDSGSTAAKFVETLQRSNEQLVKIASLVHKREMATTTQALSDKDKKELFEILNDSE
jgi:chromosome condensin MukBEF MukE localization factor